MLVTLVASGCRPAKPVSVDAAPGRPNIVLMLVDDLGWQDVGCYDIDEPCPYETPNMDALAKMGVLFRQAYAPAPTCAPSRAAILSGDHPARAQMTHVSGGRPPAPGHAIGHSKIEPWFSARMPAATVTIAEALKPHGYVTGHVGKWHIAMGHHGYPQPKDQGFDYSRSNRGAHQAMRPHRLTGFATNKEDDPYRLDENGFPFHQNHEDAMTFLQENAAKPFFLYYATWLVHAPIHTRSKPLLDKYVTKLGLELTDEHRTMWKKEGQTNPFYCAMVEELDYYFGILHRTLETTDDPRWPGHKLIENTYVIFTSDNGGAEGRREHVFTDNYPLDMGKISLKEGGTRVPLIITGPGIKAGIDSDVMINGLDFYPTILSLTGAPRPAGKQFDGCDVAPLLLGDVTDPSLVKMPDGTARDTLLWHFPNSSTPQSSIRIGDYKLVRNYNATLSDPANTAPLLELYRLYDGVTRGDIEEAKNLAEAMPERAVTMDARLAELLTGMKASYPYKNPICPRLPRARRAQCPQVVSHKQTGDTVEVSYKENGARVVRANLIYTPNPGDRFEEWFRVPATVPATGRIVAKLPKDATHCFINLIDSNNFLVSYPEIVTLEKPSNKKYVERALKVER
ncbi:MAG: sulfatase [Verrucomicrobia bacterium]|nr:sulfatase [Verrucomicrobiota bacterium]